MKKCFYCSLALLIAATILQLIERHFRLEVGRLTAAEIRQAVLNKVKLEKHSDAVNDLRKTTAAIKSIGLIMLLLGVLFGFISIIRREPAQTYAVMMVIFLEILLNLITA